MEVVAQLAALTGRHFGALATNKSGAFLALGASTDFRATAFQLMKSHPEALRGRKQRSQAHRRVA